ncbi:MAG: ABC transporter permease [Pyrinomonadaceae bacterium]
MSLRATTTATSQVLKTGGASQTVSDEPEAAEQSHGLPVLPDKPLVVGGPRKAWAGLDLSEVWAYRELLYFLTWRDLKVRYNQTLLGGAWVIIQPLFTMLVFSLFFGKLVGAPEGIPYPLFVYTGILPWTFFSNSVINSSNSLVGSSNLITKVYFPRMIIPAAAVAAGLVDLAVASLVLVGLALYYDVALAWSMLWLPVFILLATLLALGIGLGVSALSVKYRDIRHALPFILQLWMFSSPIIYPMSLFSDKWRWALSINPVTGIVEGLRSSLLGRPLDWHALSISTVMVVVLLICAAFIFRRIETSFADLI